MGELTIPVCSILTGISKLYILESYATRLPPIKPDFDLMVFDIL